MILKQVPHFRGSSVNIHLDFVSVHIHPQSPRLRHIIANYLAFPQLKEISFKMTITLGGGVNINCNYYTIFSKALCLFFCPIPSPYQDSHMQIVCGNRASSWSATHMFCVTREELQLKPDIRDFNASFAWFRFLTSFKTFLRKRQD